MERVKRSPLARITHWRQVGHCSLSWNVFINLFGCSPWLVVPLLDGSSLPYPFGTVDCVLVLQGERDCGYMEGPSGEGLLTAVFHNIGSTTSLLTQNKALSYG